MSFGIILPERWTRQPQGPAEVDHSRFGQILAAYNAPARVYEPARGRLFSEPVRRGYVATEYGLGQNRVTGSESPLYLGNGGIPIGQNPWWVLTVVKYRSASGNSGDGIGRITGAANDAWHWGERNNNADYWSLVKSGVVSLDFTSLTWSLGDTDICLLNVQSRTGAIRGWKKCVNTGVIKTQTITNASTPSAGHATERAAFSTLGEGSTYCSNALLFAEIVGTGILSEGAASALLENPWQIFRPITRRSYFTVAGGPVTITCSPGTATANGSAAAVALDVTLAGAVGTATAQGSAASVALAVTIPGAIGTATASGSAAGVALNVTVNGAVGPATASGSPATIQHGSAVTVACAIGTATANGSAAGIDLAVTVAGAVGTATAQGQAATIGFGNDVTVAGAVGTATAQGSLANLVFNATVDALIGTATARGSAAVITLSGAMTLTQADIDAIVLAIRADPLILTVPKFLALK